MILTDKLVNHFLFYKALDMGPVHPKSSGFLLVCADTLKHEEIELVWLGVLQGTTVGSRREFRG